MRGFEVHACSDVTGFSLLGHAQEMAAGTEVTIVLESTSLPVLPGAVHLAEDGHLTGGCKRNRAVPHDDAPRLVAELHAGGVSAATVVGRATKLQGTRVRLV
jgi:selenophosphate synthase